MIAEKVRARLTNPCFGFGVYRTGAHEPPSNPRLPPHKHSYSEKALRPDLITGCARKQKQQQQQQQGKRGLSWGIPRTKKKKNGT